MSQLANHVTIQLLGKSITIRCPEGQQANLEFAAKELNSRLQNMRLSSKTTDTDQLLILLALNLTVELTSLQQTITTETEQLNAKVNNLQALIDEALIQI